MVSSDALLLMLTSPLLGKESEFNTWYEQVHAPQLLQIPGIVGVSRYRLSSTQLPGNALTAHPYLSSYRLEGDLQRIAEEILTRGGDGRIDRGTAIDRNDLAPRSAIFERVATGAAG
jgi:hypothetical protein